MQNRLYEFNRIVQHFGKLAKGAFHFIFRDVEGAAARCSVIQMEVKGAGLPLS